MDVTQHTLNFCEVKCANQKMKKRCANFWGIWIGRDNNFPDCVKYKTH